MKLFSVSQLKAKAGDILDRALAGKPQYVVRGDGIAMIVSADIIAGVQRHPEGYYADCYNDPERIERENRASKAVIVRPER